MIDKESKHEGVVTDADVFVGVVTQLEFWGEVSDGHAASLVDTMV